MKKYEYAEVIEYMELDGSKENVVFLTSKAVKYEYTHGFVNKFIMDTVAKDYNIIIVGMLNKDDIKYFQDRGYRNIVNISNNPGITEKLIRSKDFVPTPECDWFRVHNQTVVVDSISKVLGDIKIKAVSIGLPSFMLPLMEHVLKPEKDANPVLKDLQNEYFDYVGSDLNVIKAIHQTNDRVNAVPLTGMSPLAFSQNENAAHAGVLECIINNNPGCLSYNYIIDPVYHWTYADHLGYKSTKFYFADDHRGTRDFTHMPMGEMQCLFGSEYQVKEDIECPKDFCFYGSIFYGKGERHKMYEKFLKGLEGLDPEKNSMYIPTTLNGIICNQKEAKRKTTMMAKYMADEKYAHLKELKDEIEANPLYKGSFLPTEQFKVVSEYKYSLLLRCTSSYDSLNFRPAFYAMAGVLPFIDSEYDPDYLQIPREIQDKLRVENGQDIKDKIEYYNSNPQEQYLLILELRILFKIREDKLYWEKEVKRLLNL